MLNHDVEARRTLVQEHRAELATDAARVDGRMPDVMESRARPRRRRLSLLRLRLQVRPARSGS